MKTIAKYITVAVLILLLISVFIWSDSLKEGIKCGIDLCLNNLVPSLFAPMCFCSLLVASGSLSPLEKAIGIVFKSSKIPPVCISVVCMSLIGGYPTGALLAEQLYVSGRIERMSARWLVMCACGSGPAYILLCVGGMLGSSYAGWILLLSHIISVILTAMIIPCRAKNNTVCGAIKYQQLDEAVVNSVYSSSRSMLLVCAYTVLFSGLMNIIKTAFQDTVYLALAPILEVSSGMAALCDGYPSLPLIAAALGFGGISVICQIKGVQKSVGTSFSSIIKARLACAAVSYAVCSLLIRIFPSYKAVFSSHTATVATATSHSYIFSGVLLIFCIVLLCSLKNRKRTVDFFKRI